MKYGGKGMTREGLLLNMRLLCSIYASLRLLNFQNENVLVTVDTSER